MPFTCAVEYLSSVQLNGIHVYLLNGIHCVWLGVLMLVFACAGVVCACVIVHSDWGNAVVLVASAGWLCAFGSVPPAIVVVACFSFASFAVFYEHALRAYFIEVFVVNVVFAQVIGVECFAFLFLFFLTFYVAFGYGFGFAQLFLLGAACAQHSEEQYV